MKKILIVSIIFLILGGLGIWFYTSQSIDTSKAVISHIGIPYANDSTTQKLNIYLPEGQGPFPVIIAIHGGAFKMGSRTATDIASMIKGLEYGYAVVTVDYQLSSEKIFPAAIDDIQGAILFIKKSAKVYNLNPEKIGLWGDSAGGNLASLAGTKGSTASGTNVQAVVDWFGPIYFSRMDDQFSVLGITPAMGKTNLESSPESAYIGKTIGSTDAEPIVKLASPETYISTEDPPFYIQHGTVDTNIPITQSIDFSNKLSSVIGTGKVIFEKLEGAKHGGSQFDSDDNLKKIFSFLDKYLK